MGRNFINNAATPPRTLLRARIILPVAAAPMADGVLTIEANKIVSLGPWGSEMAKDGNEVIDLGEVILLPGLVNAHCHLDYTHMAGQIPPQKNFIDWVKLITSSKEGWIYSHYAESWISGAKMLLETGTTTVGDVELVPELLPEVWDATPLRVVSFLEMTGVRSGQPPEEIIGEALKKISETPHDRNQIGLSPHAPYSTRPELLSRAGTAARQQKLRVTTHVAESDLEFEMYGRGGGKMFDWLQKGGRDMADCGMGSPVQHLEKNGLLGPHLLAVHANYLAAGDAELLANTGTSVVHCPRSHAFFKHKEFPFAELAAAGVNVCLGTDSLASLYQRGKRGGSLNMFEEMREFSTVHPEVAAAEILKMATLNGARALGLQNQIGEFSANACADLIAIPFAGPLEKAEEFAVHNRNPLAASMIDGRWAIAPQAPMTGKL